MDAGKNEAGDGDGDGDAWAGFTQSVAYLRQLAALYRESFTGRKPVAKAHVQEAQRQARQALELLAGNLLHASSSLLATLEAQDAAAEALSERLQGIKETLRERQRQEDEQVIQRFCSRVTADPDSVIAVQVECADNDCSTRDPHVIAELSNHSDEHC